MTSLRNLNATKQASIKRFKHPPGPGVGKDGDLGIAMVPRKGLHFFYKWGGRWYGVRMDRVVQTEEDDRRVIIPGASTKEDGELSYSGGKVQIQTSDATRKELYRVGGTDIAVTDGGTGLSTFGAANRILKTSDATTLAASDTLPNDVQDNITRVGTISNGTWQGSSISTTYTAAKVGSVSASGTGLSDGGSTVGNVTITIAPDDVAGAISANTLAWNQMADLTASKAPVINADGEMTASAVTATELGHLDGVTGAIQTQFTNKASLAGASFTGKIATNSPIGFSHHALTDVSSNQSTYDFDFGTNGNKIRLAFTGNNVTIAKARLLFPTNISGNYTVLVKNYASGAITKNEITLWTSNFGTAGTDEANIKWPAGTIPSVTEAAYGRMDIFSFYWDCDDKVAYGVSTLNFAA